jgi:hypothetical protein
MILSDKHSVPNRLVSLKSQLRSINPEQQEKFCYSCSTWLGFLPGDPDVIELNRRFNGCISRSNVIGLAREHLADQSSVRRLAMAIMMWDYGNNGRFKNNAASMLAHPQVKERLNEGAKIVRSGDLVNACLFFRDESRGKLPGGGWPFITKFFYFIGVANELDPLPLILDKKVAKGINRLAIYGNTGVVEALNLWLTSNDRHHAIGYWMYVDLVNRWARDIGCRPDAIEIELWNGLK